MNISLPDGRLPQWQTIDDLIRDRAASLPDQLAVAVGPETLSYAELDRLSDVLAANLAGLGVTDGTRVATMLYNSLEQILTFIATVKLGAICAPLNVSLESRDLAHVLRDSDPLVMVFDEDTAGKLDGLAPEVCRDRHLFVVGTRDPERAFARLLNDTDTVAPRVDNQASTPAVIIYTGGTTGLPKGVVLPHFALVAAGYRYVECFKVADDDVHYSVLTLFHVGGLFLGFMGPVVAGIPTHFERLFSASRFWDRTREVGATLIDPIGTMVTVLCKAPESPSDGDNPVRQALGVLGQVPGTVAEDFRRRFQLNVVNAYSLTESGGTVIIHNPAGSDRPESNGKAWQWAEVCIRDDEDAELPPGQLGEICLRPRVPHIFMQSYFNKPEATLEAWRNFWLHTGDVGYLDDEGYLFFTGRQAHWLRVKGENVSAHEVESIVSEYPGVEEAIVVGVPGELGENDVKVFLRLASRDGFEPAALVEWCRDKMAKFKVPRYVEIVDEFPRSATKREVERHKLIALNSDTAWDAQAATSSN